MFHLLLKSLIIGFCIAAPVGPIGLLCINRTLNQGLKTGIMTGFGAAAADGFYGAIAAFGLTAISTLLFHLQFWIHLIGGIFLIYLAIKIALTKPATNLAANNQLNSIKAFLTTFILTLSNPLTILSFLGLFAALGAGSSHPQFNEALLMVIGVFIGSLLWWLILSTLIAKIIRTKLSEKALIWINRSSAFIILCFGIAALVL